MAERWRIVRADLRGADLRELVGDGYHAVLCDPPYGLAPDGRARTWDDDDAAARGFMGKAWDGAVPGVTFWRGVLRCLRPGAHVAAFGGTRTYHRLACAVEDAGFEVRDMLAWLYGSGFPKSHDVSKAIDAGAGAEREVVSERETGWRGTLGGKAAMRGLTTPDLRRVTAPATPDAVRWDGYGTALKPAHEPVVLARVPLDGTVAHNALTHGCGALAIDAARVATTDKLGGGHASSGQQMSGGWRRPWMNNPEAVQANAERSKLSIARSESLGRWPANVLLDEHAAAMLDEQSGWSKSTDRPRNNGAFKSVAKNAERARVGFGHSDHGGASRFFYVAKASRRERKAGLDGMKKFVIGSLAGGGEGSNDPVSKRFTKVARNHHPTVKPIDLTTYVARMLLPPPGSEPRRILVPFSGSGSEVIGALLAGWDEVVGVELDAEYIDIAKARIAHWLRKPRKSSKPKPAPVRKPVLQQLEMF